MIFSWKPEPARAHPTTVGCGYHVTSFLPRGGTCHFNYYLTIKLFSNGVWSVERKQLWARTLPKAPVATVVRLGIYFPAGLPQSGIESLTLSGDSHSLGLESAPGQGCVAAPFS